MAERSNAAVLKTVVPQGTGGSNPSFSAKFGISVAGYPFLFWRDGRVVECGGLENRCPLRWTGGSNPSLSAFKTIGLSLQCIWKQKVTCEN